MILILIMSIPVYYFVLLNAQTQDRPFESRIAEAVFGTLLDIASPVFWTLLIIIIGLFEIGRLTIKFYREKKDENAQVQN